MLPRIQVYFSQADEMLPWTQFFQMLARASRACPPILHSVPLTEPCLGLSSAFLKPTKCSRGLSSAFPQAVGGLPWGQFIKLNRLEMVLDLSEVVHFLALCFDVFIGHVLIEGKVAIYDAFRCKFYNPVGYSVDKLVVVGSE